MKYSYWATLSFLILLLSGCQQNSNSHTSTTTSSFFFTKKDPRENADKIATAAGFQLATVNTQSFVLTTYQKFNHPNEINKSNAQNNSSNPTKSNPTPHLTASNNSSNVSSLTIYIEGDGQSWITRYKISDDPTPRNPLALKLAVLDPSPNVAYLARPCQYTPLHLNRACTPDIWSDSRFSEMVIANMNQAVETLKHRSNAKQIHLVGFSGGAAVAALIAARRTDIASLRTVAGDLDHVALSKYHKTTPLDNSLNPKAVAYQLTRLPQYHFSGEKDNTVPPFIAEGFVSEVLNSKRNLYAGRHVKFFVVKGATHHKGWEEIWPNLLLMPLY